MVNTNLLWVSMFMALGFHLYLWLTTLCKNLPSIIHIYMKTVTYFTGYNGQTMTLDDYASSNNNSLDR